MKFFGFAAHSISNLIVSQISYAYFKDKSEKAQMICVMLLANERERVMNQLMFNDQVLGISIFAAIYFVTCQKSYFWGGVFLSWGISLKAGGILLIPAFLANIQYTFGLRSLFITIFIIIGFQFQIGYIFWLRDWDSYWLDSRLLGHGNQETTMAASYDASVFWTFLSKDFYHKSSLASSLQIFIVVLNTIHFFVTQDCLPQSLYNVFSEFVSTNYLS